MCIAKKQCFHTFVRPCSATAIQQHHPMVVFEDLRPVGIDNKTIKKNTLIS